MATDELKGLLERHAAFWNRGEKVLLKQVSEYRPLGKGGGEGRKSLPLADGSQSEEGQFITPEMIDPQRFYGDWQGPKNVVHGDFIAGAGPPHLCWTEAMVGCPVRVVTGGPWAEPFAADWRAPERLQPDARWLDKLDAFVDFLAERAAGKCPIVQPLMRGPVDMMASAVGHEAMCLALMEEPEAADAFLAVCAEFFVEAAQRRLAHTPPFEGGYLSGYGIWAPGTVVRNQADNATMLSPKVYREKILAHDRKVIESFDFPLIHLHSGCLHVAEILCELERLKAIQVSIDHPGGPLAAEVMPILERVIERKALIVTGPVDGEELDALEGLAQRGSLCIQVSLVEAHAR